MTGLTTEMLADCQRALDDEGYVILRDVVSKEGLTDFNRVITDEFERVNTSGQLFEGGGFISGHLNCVPGESARFAYNQIVDAGIVELIRHINPAWAVRPRATLNFNLPHSSPQHYHMDGIYTADFLICNIAVVDTNLVNGALDVLPGTHQQFYRFWQYAVKRKYRSTTRVPLHQGDVVLRRSTLWHRGMPNRSQDPRAMLAFTFGEMDEPTTNPFATNDGQIEFYPNWFQPSALGRLRERTFVAAPITYSAFRFARSLFSDKGYSS